MIIISACRFSNLSRTAHCAKKTLIQSTPSPPAYINYVPRATVDYDDYIQQRRSPYSSARYPSACDYYGHNFRPTSRYTHVWTQWMTKPCSADGADVLMLPHQKPKRILYAMWRDWWMRAKPKILCHANNLQTARKHTLKIVSRISQILRSCALFICGHLPSFANSHTANHWTMSSYKPRASYVTHTTYT